MPPKTIKRQSLITDREIYDRLRKLTGGDGQINLSQKGQLIQAIVSGIIDWETLWKPERYAGFKVEEGEVLSRLERMDLSRRIFHNQRGLVW